MRKMQREVVVSKCRDGLSPRMRHSFGQNGTSETKPKVLPCELRRYFFATIFFCLALFSGRFSLANEKLSSPDQTWISNDIHIEGNKFFDERKLLSELKTKSCPGTDLVERNIDRILTLYDEKGFPYCQVSPSDFRISEKGGLSFSLNVQEGPRVAIREIQLEGLKITKKKVIMREVETDLFGYFSPRRVDQSLSKLRRLSYIKDVKGVELLSGKNPEDGILRITLAERRNSSFSGILGYLPSSGGSKGNLFGSMALVLDNMFGTGRRMEWSWSRKDPYSSQFIFLYREPWVFGFSPALELKVNQLDYDSTYLQLSFSARLIFNSTERISWGIEGGWEKVVPGSDGKNYLPDSRKYNMGVIFTLDLLDQPDNPRRGLFYQMEIGYAQKRNYPTSFFIPEKQKTSLANLSLGLNNFLPTLRKQTLFIGMHLKSLSTDDNVISLSDQFKLGGINNLRGYREEEFFGSRIAWTNLEYRFLLDENSRFFLFTDYGYFERKVAFATDQTSRKISGKKLGYGFGLRIDSKAGLLGIDYGLGEGDKLSQGKIHFGVVNNF